jgi:hypothetical protein
MHDDFRPGRGIVPWVSRNVVGVLMELVSGYGSSWTKRPVCADPERDFVTLHLSVRTELLEANWASRGIESGYDSSHLAGLLGE